MRERKLSSDLTVWLKVHNKIMQRDRCIKDFPDNWNIGWFLFVDISNVSQLNFIDVNGFKIFEEFIFNSELICFILCYDQWYVMNVDFLVIG